MPDGDSAPAVMCATLGHGNQRATRYVSCEGNGSYPYCDECADVLIRGGEQDGGATDDPVVAERDRLQHIIDCANTPLMRDVMAERDRLREALERIADHSQEMTCDLHAHNSYGQALGHVHWIAREALENEQEPERCNRPIRRVDIPTEWDFRCVLDPGHEGPCEPTRVGL